MSKSRWQQYKEKNGVTPLDMLNPSTKRASDDLATQRFDICLSCPELIKVTKQCKQCGCFMAAKTKLESAKCPLGKW
jgi:hypothetical protein